MAINPHKKGGPDIPVADGGTGASDDTNARTNLGVDLTVASHGTLDHAGVPGIGTGKVAQQIRTLRNTSLFINAVVVGDPPQFGGGQAIMEATITPTSASSTLVIEFTSWGTFSATVPSIVIMQLHKDSSGNAIAATQAMFNSTPGNGMHTVQLVHFQVAGDVSAQTFQLRMAVSGAGGTNFTINPAYFGTVARTNLIVTEYLA